jgi:hypothetical protein
VKCAFLTGIVSLTGPGSAHLFAQADSLEAQADSVPAAIDSIPPPTIDTIVIERHNVWTEEEAAGSGVMRLMNRLHIVTKPWVIQYDIRFKVGQPYDSALVHETERLLLERQIFTSVSTDTTRFGDKLGVVVTTNDAWSFKPKFSFSAASDGTITGTIGVNDVSLLGTGNQAYVAYKKEVDREGLNLSADFGRVLGSNIDIVGNYAGMSDGKNGNWEVGTPYRYMETTRALTYRGSGADQRIFRFIASNNGQLDSVTFRHESFINNVAAGWAPIANSKEYLRIIGGVGVRSQTYVRQLDSIPPVADSVFGTLGATAQYRKAHFKDTERFNGFGQEVLDLSPTASVRLTLAPEAFGYRRTGIGPGIGGTTSKSWGPSWVWVSLIANGVFDSSGLDSGRVVANAVFGTKFGERFATGLQIQGGVLENTAPGTEFDLGFQNVLRSWEPHSFIGTREFWGTFEQRWYVWDKLFNLVGIGFAAFADYGGAWYKEQGARLGGDVGIGIRIGSALSAIPRTSKFDVGYRFGDGVIGSAWAVSFGAAFVFPWRHIPVTCYQAVPPQVTDCRRSIN